MNQSLNNENPQTNFNFAPRVSETAQLMIQGLDNQEIANQLSIGIGTLKTYIHTIFEETGSSTRTEAIFKLKPQNTNELETSPIHHFGLTDRELEIVQLVAKGQTNPQIGESLFIATGTVKTHLRNIMNKLDARKREQIAAIYHGHISEQKLQAKLSSLRADKVILGKESVIQTRVAELITEGLTNTQIAAELNIRIRTVKSHLNCIKRSLEVNSRVGIMNHLNGAVNIKDIDPILIQPFGLTERELEIAQLIMQSCSNVQIGEALYISTETVKTHVRNIISKMSAGSRERAMAIFHSLAKKQLQQDLQGIRI